MLERGGMNLAVPDADAGDEAAAEPTAAAPAEPSAEAPAEPSAEAPAEPSADAPAEDTPTTEGGE